MYKKDSRGFTLIELMLAIAFLGSIVLFATLTVVQSLSVYNKGVAIKQINQVGRTLIEDVNRLSGGGQSGVASSFKIDDNDIAGYLCITPSGSSDTRAYVWTDVLKEAAAINHTYVSPSAPRTPVSLARTNEGVNGVSLCGLPSGSDTAVAAGNITPLLNDQVRILSVDITEDSDNASLKKIIFWIGTYGGIGAGAVPGTTPVFNDADRTWSCQGGNLGNFCAFGKFETIVYAPNED